ncbi:hypothetical protein QYE76_035545 [Lolium multiflorum]|uniref:RNase H type-1 domain-containing protein n=1 Tax=Lolium multiflorum TaxID=4521 RepID=A0AAD8R091_LOLMU|nr:hypothetical protein QYE76_035545 [Lolium multiflorum]
MPPMVVITHDAKTYMHQAQEPAQFQTMQSKKAQRRPSATAQKERRELMLEARALLKESTRASINGSTEASQRLQAKAASKKAGVASLRAPKTIWRNELELLKGLEDASQNLRRLVTNARSSDSPHPLRNYRRKYRKVQRLHQQMSSRIAQNAVLDEDWSFGAKDLADEVLSCDLLPDKRASESSSVKEVVRRAIMKEVWKRCSCKEHVLPGYTAYTNSEDARGGMCAPCFHTSMIDDRPIRSDNRFTVIRIKGQALAEFLVAHPVPDDSPLITNIPDEEAFAVELEAPWELYFDYASRMEVDPDGTPRRRAWAGLVFKTPQGGVMYHSFSLLKKECSNNEADYEALIFGLLLALSMEARSLRAYGDSQLIVRQVNDIYEECTCRCIGETGIGAGSPK